MTLIFFFYPALETLVVLLFRTLILSPAAICLFSFAHTPRVFFFYCHPHWGEIRQDARRVIAQQPKHGKSQQ